MKSLLSAIRLQHFYGIALRRTGGDIWEDAITHVAVAQFIDGKITVVLDEACASDDTREAVLRRLQDTIGDVPLVLFSSADIDFLHASFHAMYDNKDRASPFLMNECWDLQRLASTLLPVISFATLEELAVYFTFPEGENPASSEAVILIFYQLIESLARMEPRIVSQANRFLEHSKSPLKRILRGLADYIRDGKNIHFIFPEVQWPTPAPNVIGVADGGFFSDTIHSVPDSDIRRFFSPQGGLSRSMEAYEERAEQTRLTVAINSAFNASQHILAEAGTGTGKSLAYLIPAIHWASYNNALGEQVVISTHTKNLQDQLFYKDIPLLARTLPFGFRAVLLKGRSNYICMKKWTHITADAGSHVQPQEREKLLPILFWIHRTRTGDISECVGFQAEANPGVWHKLASESAYCQAQRCSRSEDCFVRKIREEAKQAHVVVVNHALLFSDLVSDNAILGDYHNLVLDEAHNVEKVAQNYLGAEFSLWAVRGLTSKLYERDQTETGVLIQLRQKLQKSRLSDALQSAFLSQIQTGTDACVQFWLAAQALFQRLTTEALRKTEFAMQGDKAVRGERRVRYGPTDSLLLRVADDVDLMHEKAVKLHQALDVLSETMRQWPTDAMDGAEEMRDLIILRTDELDALLKTVDFLTEGANKDYVYWYEMPPKERSYDMRFYAVPLNIADILRNTLLEKLKTCVFSSATLSVAGQFNYYKRRIGLDAMRSEKVQEFTADSPFDYKNQSRILVPTFLPEPQSPKYNDACAELLKRITLETRRGMLVLFTSYQMMNSCYYQLRDPLNAAGIPLLMQGRDASRTQLTEHFRRERVSVLFGTDSFWEGVDVPGSALEILVITKLPFEVPSDPLVAAKMERIDAQGGKSFFDYSVPEAVIKFRQGFGRLIRSRSDRGVALVFDNRVVTKSYGSYFMRSLPVQALRMPSEELLMNNLTTFFSIT